MVVTWIIAGIIVGSFSMLFASARDIEQPARTLIVGCIGAAIGGLVNMAVTPYQFGDISLLGFLCALISAAILLFGYREIQTV
jgi:uncharacterized membrane protein YeaQ/YmgE (transglycosylase-associated protein family)